MRLIKIFLHLNVMLLPWDLGIVLLDLLDNYIKYDECINKNRFNYIRKCLNFWMQLFQLNAERLRESKVEL